MFRKLLVIAIMSAAFSASALANQDDVATNTEESSLTSDSSSAEHRHVPWNGPWGWGGDCRYYNRDGITCRQVGYFEGQVGTPWGFDAGQFRCINGCLQWLGGSGGYTTNACYNLNRDGITCAQVGFYEGQIGTPWGHRNGYFRCTSGCLQFVGN